uniref:KIND domain-containing protein n=1 Tax=Romanomermis culicivorax TaxID=13658 RepID=A0A915KL32_ROMCU
MTTAPVTLTEVLQLRENGGLINDEILAVLKLGSQSLSTLIESAKISSVQNMGFSMDSVYFLSEGSVLLKPLPFEILNETFIPPECLLDEKPEKLTSRNLDKMYIFSFGAVLIFALEYGNKGVVMSTPEVYSLLNLMTIRDPTVRLNLEKVAQMTERLVQANKVDTTRVIQKLFDSIVENGGEFDHAVQHKLDKIELSTDEKIASNVEESSSSDEINHLPDIIARLENSSDSRESPFTDQIKDVFDGDKDYLINAQEFPVKILRYSDNNAVTNSQTLCLPPMPKAPICDIIVEKFVVEMIESIPIDGTFNFENITSNEHRESSSEDKEIAYGILNHDNLPENIRIESNSLQRKEISSLDLSNVAELIGIPSTVVSHLDYSLAEESDDNDEDNASFNGRTGVKIIVPYFETYSPVTINSLEKNDGDFLDENVSYPETNYLIDEKHDSSAKPPFEISVSNKHLDMPENDKLSVNVVDGSVILPFDTDFDTYLNNKNDAFAADFTENRTTNETRSTKSAGILQKLMPMSPDDFFQLKSHGELVLFMLAEKKCQKRKAEVFAQFATGARLPS